MACARDHLLEQQSWAGVGRSGSSHIRCCFLLGLGVKNDGGRKRGVHLQGQGQSDFLEDCSSQSPGWGPRMIEDGGGGVGMGPGGESSRPLTPCGEVSRGLTSAEPAMVLRTEGAQARVTCQIGLELLSTSALKNSQEKGER